MSHYYPDRWIVIKIISIVDHNFGEIHYRVFGNWSGGYLHGDSWKLNSGIVSVEEDDEAYHFHGNSGSVYHCLKSSYGMTSYGHSVLNGMIKNTSDKILIVKLPEDTNFSEIEYKT